MSGKDKARRDLWDAIHFWANEARGDYARHEKIVERRTKVDAAIDALLRRAEMAEEELEQYRLRLAGALTTVEGHSLDVQERVDTAPFIRSCPTIEATIRVRRELEAARVTVERLTRERDFAEKLVAEEVPFARRLVIAHGLNRGTGDEFSQRVRDSLPKGEDR